MSKKKQSLLSVLDTQLEALNEDIRELADVTDAVRYELSWLNATLYEMFEHVKKEGLKWRQR